MSYVISLLDINFNMPFQETSSNPFKAFQIP